MRLIHLLHSLRGSTALRQTTGAGLQRHRDHPHHRHPGRRCGHVPALDHVWLQAWLSDSAGFNAGFHRVESYRSASRTGGARGAGADRFGGTEVGLPSVVRGRF